MQVTLFPSPTISLTPHPQLDGGIYSSFENLSRRIAGEGYSGGMRLLKVHCSFACQMYAAYHVYAACMKDQCAERKCLQANNRALSLQAICKRFLEACRERNISLPQEKYFNLSYDTNIPRQSGLSGSSAIICAALNCLLEFYGVEDRSGILQSPRFSNFPANVAHLEVHASTPSRAQPRPTTWFPCLI